MLKVVKAKKYQLKGKMIYGYGYGLKIYQNGSFDFWTFWTFCPKINRNPLSSLQSCTSSSKHLFYLVLWDLFINLFVYLAYSRYVAIRK